MKYIRVIVYVVLIVVLSTLGTFGFIEAKSNDEGIQYINPNEIIITNNQSNNSKYELLVHLYNDVSCTDNSCMKLVKIKTETPFAKELVVKHYANYILIYDGVIKLVNVNDKTQEVLNMTYKRGDNFSLNLKEESEVITDNAGKKIESIVSSNQKNIIYYDYIDGKIYESEQYDNIVSYDNYYLANKESKTYLLNDKGIKIIEINNDINKDNLNKIVEDNNTYALSYINNKKLNTFVVYDNSGKEILKKSGDYKDISLMNDNIYVYEIKRLVIYNLNGKINKIVDIEGYDLKLSHKNYMISVKDGNLISYNVSNDDAVVITNVNDSTIEEIFCKNNDLSIKLRNSNGEIKNISYNLENKRIKKS